MVADGTSRIKSNTGNASIKRQGHTKDSRGRFGTNPMVKSMGGDGNSTDLTR